LSFSEPCKRFFLIFFFRIYDDRQQGSADKAAAERKAAAGESVGIVVFSRSREVVVDKTSEIKILVMTFFF
jgi:hypothetical protein